MAAAVAAAAAAAAVVDAVMMVVVVVAAGLKYSYKWRRSYGGAGCWQKLLHIHSQKLLFGPQDHHCPWIYNCAWFSVLSDSIVAHQPQNFWRFSSLRFLNEGLRYRYGSSRKQGTLI